MHALQECLERGAYSRRKHWKPSKLQMCRAAWCCRSVFLTDALMNEVSFYYSTGSEVGLREVVTVDTVFWMLERDPVKMKPVPLAAVSVEMRPGL